MLREVAMRNSSCCRRMGLPASMGSAEHVVSPQEELWIIDVSQAVDLDHPRALDFLREDAAHINSYFRRAGVATLTTRELFEFVVDPNILAGNIDQAVEALMKVAASRPCATGEDEIAEKVGSEHLMHFNVEYHLFMRYQSRPPFNALADCASAVVSWLQTLTTCLQI